MDTVEHHVIKDSSSPTGFKFGQSAVWRGKSAREVQREKYPDHYFITKDPPPKSIRKDVEYSRQYQCLPYPEERPRNMKDGEIAATLTEIS